MKNNGFQIALGLLLAVSSTLLTISATSMNRLNTRMDRVEGKLGAHCENFTLHVVNK